MGNRQALHRKTPVVVSNGLVKYMNLLNTGYREGWTFMLWNDGDVRVIEATDKELLRVKLFDIYSSIRYMFSKNAPVRTSGHELTRAAANETYITLSLEGNFRTVRNPKGKVLATLPDCLARRHISKLLRGGHECVDL